MKSTNKLLNLRQTLLGLRYISESPAQEHGGFHPMTVQIAKSALKHFGQRKSTRKPK